jgi:hypothetical protein
MVFTRLLPALALISVAACTSPYDSAGPSSVIGGNGVAKTGVTTIPAPPPRYYQHSIDLK